MDIAMAATTTLLNAGSMEGIAIYSTLFPTAKWSIPIGSVMENAISAATTLLSADMTEGIVFN